MRALILSHSYSDQFSRGKIRALSGLGVELAVATPGGSAGLDAGARFVPVPAKGDRADPGSLRWSAPEVRRILSDLHPDLLQIEEAPGTPAASTAAAAARRIGIPYVLFSSESLPRRRGLFEGRRYRSSISHASGLIGANQLAARLLAQVAPRTPITVLPQFGVTPAAPVARPADRAGLRLGFVGRLVPERGGELLLRALSQLYGKWTLLVVGTGPEQEALESLAERLGLASRIRWQGGVPRAELGPLWDEIDCLVMPSRNTPAWVERANPVLLEAMSRGITPVVLRAGALPELVGDAGIVVEDQEGLAAALQELLAEPPRLRALGERARERILEEFVDAALAARTLAFWETVLREAAAGATPRRRSR